MQWADLRPPATSYNVKRNDRILFLRGLQGKTAEVPFDLFDLEVKGCASNPGINRATYHILAQSGYFMTIAEVRSLASSLRDRAETLADDESLGAEWEVLELLYREAEQVLPGTVAGFVLLGEPVTKENLARLASALVTACDHAAPPPPHEIPGDYGA
jgi:hypothetical protein